MFNMRRRERINYEIAEKGTMSQRLEGDSDGVSGVDRESEMAVGDIRVSTGERWTRERKLNESSFLILLC